MNTDRMIQTKAKTRSQDTTQAGIDGITRISINAMVGISGLIGLWAAATLISAMVIHGPIAVVSGWFGAVAGLW